MFVPGAFYLHGGSFQRGLCRLLFRCISTAALTFFLPETSDFYNHMESQASMRLTPYIFLFFIPPDGPRSQSYRQKIKILKPVFVSMCGTRNIFTPLKLVPFIRNGPVLTVISPLSLLSLRFLKTHCLIDLLLVINGVLLHVPLSPPLQLQLQLAP